MLDACVLFSLALCVSVFYCSGALFTRSTFAFSKLNRFVCMVFMRWNEGLRGAVELCMFICGVRVEKQVDAHERF